MPAPAATEPGSIEASGVSRAVLRRLRRGASEAWLVHQAVAALNGLHGGGESFSSAGETTLAQRLCLDRLRRDVALLGPPPGDLTPLAALRELQAAPSYDGDCAGRAEPMDVSRVSLPPVGTKPVSLGTLLGREGFDRVHRDIPDKVLPKHEVDVLKKGADLFQEALHEPRAA